MPYIAIELINAIKIKSVLIATFVSLYISLHSVASAEEAPSQVEMAKTFVTQMSGGQFEKAVKPFDQTMSKALPAEKLKQVWDGLIKENGSFQRMSETRTEKIRNL